MNRSSPASAGVDAQQPAAASAGAKWPQLDKALVALRGHRAELDQVRAALTDILFADLHQADALRKALEQAYQARQLTMSQFRQLSSELHRLITEEIPTDSLAPPASAHRQPPAAPARRKSVATKPGLGDRLRGRFQLEECIAEGPHGRVYRASDLLRAESGATDTTVVVKLLGPANQSPQAARRALGGAMRAQGLAHPNIVRIFDADREGEASFITMEWLEGESLAARLDRVHPDALPAESLQRLVRELVSALTYAHRLGVVHGDLKPANVFLTKAGETKLLDFEAAASATDAAGLTPEYASCEQLEGAPASPADDVYAAACLIYRAAAGSRPFGLRNALEAEADGARAARIAGVSDAQWATLNRALAFRRADRLTDLNDLNALFEHVGRTSPESAAELEPRVSRWWFVFAVTIGLATAAYWFAPPSLREPVLERWQALAGRSRATPTEPRVSLPEPAAPSQADVVPDSGVGDAESDEAPAVVAAEPLLPSVVRTEFDPDIQPTAEQLTASPSGLASGAAGGDSQATAGSDDPAASADSVGSDRSESVETVAATPVAQAEALPAGGPLGFAQSQYTVGEADGFVRLLIRAPTGHPGIALRLLVSGGSAAPGDDFALARRDLVLDPGQTRLELLWPLVDDALPEYLEEVELRLESLTEGFPVQRADTLIIILDDDGT